MLFVFFKKTKKKDDTLSKTISKNFENNSQIVKNSLIATKKIIPTVSKVLDYSVIVILTFFASKYYINNYS
jgi:hypothetical protein